MKLNIFLLVIIFLWSCSSSKSGIQSKPPLESITIKQPNNISNDNDTSKNAGTLNTVESSKLVNTSGEQANTVSTQTSVSNETVVADCEANNTTMLPLPLLMIERRIPVIGSNTKAQVKLSALDNDIVKALSDNKIDSVDIALCLQIDNEKASIIKNVNNISLETAGSIHTLEWQPEQPGSAKIWATVKLNNTTAMKTEVMDIFAHQRSLSFFHETPNDNQKWITSGVYEETQDLEKIEGTGIKTLVAVDGSSVDNADTLNDQQWSDAWYSASGKNYSGILIDSFENNNSINEIMGRAVTLFNQSYPDHFIVSFSNGLNGSDMTAGLTKANLRIIKQNARDWRSYNGMNKYDQLTSANLNNQGILGINLNNASHTYEIRQQIAFIRTQYPDMPGIGFFNNSSSSREWAAIDQAIYDYYLGPAILLKSEADDHTVHNLGALNATDVIVQYFDTNGDEISQETLPLLAGNTHAALSLPEGAVTVKLKRDITGYTVINYLATNEKPAYTTEESVAVKAWLEAQKLSKDSVKPLAGSPVLNLIQNSESNNLEASVFPVSGFKANAPVTISFDIKHVAAWFYANNNIQLGNDNLYMKIRLLKQDSDTDVPAGNVRYHFEFNSANGKTSYITAPVIASNQLITVVMHYDPAKEVVRNIMFDGDSLLSDTGDINIDGPFSFDKLSFIPNSSANSVIEWIDNSDVVDALRVYSNCCGVGSYRVDSHISNVEIFGEKTE